MHRTISRNRVFFILTGLFILLGGTYTIVAGKPDALLFFSDHRSWFGDRFFRFVTKFGEYYIYVIAALVCAAIRLRYSLLIILTGLTVLGLSQVLKVLFAEDRPLAFFRKLQQEGMLHLVDGVDVHTGATSFPSGHTMSAFAIFSLLAFLFEPKRPLAAILFLLAFLVAISRMYLLQHFWVDVYAGAIIGTVVALVIYKVQSRFPANDGKWIDRPLIKRKFKKYS